VRIGSVGCRLVAEFGQGAAPAFRVYLLLQTSFSVARVVEAPYHQPRIAVVYHFKHGGKEQSSEKQ
jgi:hypothetical protein